jgi:hypothetical protein
VSKQKHKVMQVCMRLLFCEVFILLQIISRLKITDFFSILLKRVGISIKSIHLLKERKIIVALIEQAKELTKFNFFSLKL